MKSKRPHENKLGQNEVRWWTIRPEFERNLFSSLIAFMSSGCLFGVFVNSNTAIEFFRNVLFVSLGAFIIGVMTVLPILRIMRSIANGLFWGSVVIVALCLSGFLYYRNASGPTGETPFLIETAIVGVAAIIMRFASQRLEVVWQHHFEQQ